MPSSYHHSHALIFYIQWHINTMQMSDQKAIFQVKAHCRVILMVKSSNFQTLLQAAKFENLVSHQVLLPMATIALPHCMDCVANKALTSHILWCSPMLHSCATDFHTA